jgi:hypothetical protein
MSSLPVEPHGEPPGPVKGVQTPRIFCGPDGFEDQGKDVAEFLAANGLILDPWQRFVFEKGLVEREDDQWAAFEVVVTVGRQNGKTLLLAGREIAGLFMFGEELIVHTAHQWKTAHKSFLLVQKLIRRAPDLMSKVKRFSASPGQDVILLKDGRSIEFIARTKASGVGWSADCVVLDEAFDIDSEQLSALMPTVLAMPNPQIWYASTAAKSHSEHLFFLRDRALRGDSDAFCYMEWSAPEGCDPTDRYAWAQSMPALGERIPEERLEKMQKGMPAEKFGREVLGWPDSQGAGSIFPAGTWDSCCDPGSTIAGTITFALEVSQDREWACIGAAGLRSDGLTHVECVEYRRGTSWVADWLAARSYPVVIQPTTEAVSLISELEKRRVTVIRASEQNFREACGQFYDSVVDSRDIRHLSQTSLDISVASALKKSSGRVDRLKSLVVNWPRLVVNSLEERLDVDGFRLAQDQPADDELWRIWQANDLDEASQMAHVDALVHGRSFAIVWADPDDP